MGQGSCLQMPSNTWRNEFKLTKLNPGTNVFLSKVPLTITYHTSLIQSSKILFRDAFLWYVIQRWFPVISQAAVWIIHEFGRKPPRGSFLLSYYHAFHLGGDGMELMWLVNSHIPQQCMNACCCWIHTKVVQMIMKKQRNLPIYLL